MSAQAVGRSDTVVQDSYAASAEAARAACDRCGNLAMARHATATTAGCTAGTLETRPEPPVAVITTADGSAVLGPNGKVTYGRGSDVSLRIGHAPVDDDLVPRVAGAFFVRNDRVVVENRGPRLAFDIAVPGRALLPLSPGDWHSPADPTFTVVVQGTLRYELAVTSTLAGRLAAPLGGEPSPDTGSAPMGSHEIELPSGGATGGVPDLTERQRAILDAYVAPMADGYPPATHQQVADVIGCCRQTVRLECANIVEAFLVAGIPMRDWRDARDAITDAWARHRL